MSRTTPGTGWRPGARDSAGAALAAIVAASFLLDDRCLQVRASPHPEQRASGIRSARRSSPISPRAAAPPTSSSAPSAGKSSRRCPAPCPTRGHCSAPCAVHRCGRTTLVPGVRSRDVTRPCTEPRMPWKQSSVEPSSPAVRSRWHRGKSALWTGPSGGAASGLRPRALTCLSEGWAFSPKAALRELARAGVGDVPGRERPSADPARRSSSPEGSGAFISSTMPRG